MSHVLQQLSLLPQVNPQCPSTRHTTHATDRPTTPPTLQPFLDHPTTQFWHCALAWLFYAYIVQGRTAVALERVVRERVVWYWLATVAVAGGVSAMCFYAPAGSKLHRAEVGG